MNTAADKIIASIISVSSKKVVCCQPDEHAYAAGQGKTSRVD
jgi:hypothetical protein